MENMAFCVVLFPKSCYKIMFVRIVGIGKHSLLVRWVLFFCPKYTWDTLGIHQNQERIHVDTRRIHLDTR